MDLEPYGLNTIIPALQLIRAKHHGSVLSAAFGSDFVINRIRELAARACVDAKLASGTEWDFDGFVHACYHELSTQDGIPRGLPPNSIPFFAWPSTRFNAYPFYSNSRCPWYLPDMLVSDASRVVPCRRYVAYAEKSATRRRNVEEAVDPMPLFFIRNGDGGLGTSVEGPLPSLCFGEQAFCRSDGTPRKSMKIKINWPGYPDWEKQIRPTSDKGDCSIKRLAELVAAKVRTFLSEHDASRTSIVGSDSRWLVGSESQGQISSRDIILVGLLVVSGGSAMPILRVRDEFVFASQENASQESTYHI